MDASGDFVRWLGADMSIKILNCLEDPSDLVRVASVSSSWRQFVIENGLSKRLCLRMFPAISRFTNVVEMNNMRPENSTEWACLERDYRVYALLARCLTSFRRKNCISEAISASSTDNYPAESIQNTLEPSDRVEQRASYWSSKGQIDPAVPETLLYQLMADLCVITEIHIQPFLAYFQLGFPIYSAKAVRFRMGHRGCKMNDESNNEKGSEASEESADREFIWTYTSPPFTMAQENCLQKFKLPEPVLCIGGILQIELLGRVQRQEMDGLYYICVSHVRVVGRPLSPFGAEIDGTSGNWTLRYYPEAMSLLSPRKSDERERSSSSPPPSHFNFFNASIRGWEQMILNTLLGGGGGAAGVENNDDSDDEFFG